MSLNRWQQSSFHLGTIVTIALALCVMALLNGQPFFYPDMPTYLRGAEMGAAKLAGPGRLKPWLPAAGTCTDAVPAATVPALEAEPAAAAAAPAARKLKPLTSVADKVVLAGRSVYYGALLYAGYLVDSNMWLAVVFQALCVAYVLQLLMVQLWGLRGGQALAIAAALSLLTPLGLYTGFLMPDIFAPLVILAAGALAVYWRQLARGQRWLLAAILLFGLCAHSSHVALAALLLALGVLARLLFVRWRALSGAALLVLAVCIVAAGAAEWAFGKAVTSAMGAPPLRLPHPMARLIDLGPGTAYLRQHCPSAGYAVCDYVQNLPTAWDDFLFSADPAKGVFGLADAATKRRLSDEQLRFVFDVVRFDPWGVISGVGLDVLRQLGQFKVDVGGYGPSILDMYEGRVPDRIFADMQRSRAGQPWALNEWLTATSYAMVLASLVAAMWLRRRSHMGLPAPAQQRLSDFAAVVIVGVVANAMVCAGLASSMDRFQARVVWLVPFLVLSFLAVIRQARFSEAGAAAPQRAGPPADLSIQGVHP